MIVCVRFLVSETVGIFKLVLPLTPPKVISSACGSVEYMNEFSLNMWNKSFAPSTHVLSKRLDGKNFGFNVLISNDTDYQVNASAFVDKITWRIGTTYALHDIAHTIVYDDNFCTDILGDVNQEKKNSIDAIYSERPLKKFIDYSWITDAHGPVVNWVPFNDGNIRGPRDVLGDKLWRMCMLYILYHEIGHSSLDHILWLQNDESEPIVEVDLGYQTNNLDLITERHIAELEADVFAASGIAGMLSDNIYIFNEALRPFGDVAKHSQELAIRLTLSLPIIAAGVFSLQDRSNFGLWSKSHPSPLVRANYISRTLSSKDRRIAYYVSGNSRKHLFEKFSSSVWHKAFRDRLRVFVRKNGPRSEFRRLFKVGQNVISKYGSYNDRHSSFWS